MNFRIIQATLVGLIVITTTAWGQYPYSQQQNGQPSNIAIPRYPLYGQATQGQSPQPSNRTFQSQRPYVANNGRVIPGYGGFGANRYQEDAPQTEPPASTSDLPIPGKEGNQNQAETIEGRRAPGSGQGAAGSQQQGVPYQGVPQHGVPQHGVPYQGVPHQGVPQQGVPYQGVPYQGVPQQGVPYQGGSGTAYPGQVNPQQQGYQPQPAQGRVLSNGYPGPAVGGGYAGSMGDVYGYSYANPFQNNYFRSAAQPGCGPVAPVPVRPRNWYAGLGGLILNRDFEDDKVFAYPLGMPLNNSLVSTMADPGAMGGVEAIVGRRFCNGTALELSYWGIFSELGQATASGGNPQTAMPTLDYLSYDPGGGAAMVDTHVNAAVAHRIQRTNEFHNIEVNFFRRTFASSPNNCCGAGGFGGFRGGAGYGGAGYGGAGYGGAGYGVGGFGSGGCGPGGPAVGGYGAGGCGPNGGCGTAAGYGSCQSCGGAGHAGGVPCQACGVGPRALGWAAQRWAAPRRFRFDLLAGFRYFRFDENFFFRSSTTGDFMPHVDDIYYNINLDNQLAGFQVGGQIDYCLFPRWSLTGGTRLGIYGNQINHRQRIYGLNGNAYANTGAYTGQDYDISSTKTDVAFLGQFDIGLRYDISCRWSLGFGYRVVSVTGVALAPEQIPYDFSHYQNAGYINSNGGLLLHGAYVRMLYNF